jgi:hypothetical protein
LVKAEAVKRQRPDPLLSWPGQTACPAAAEELQAKGLKLKAKDLKPKVRRQKPKAKSLKPKA